MSELRFSIDAKQAQNEIRSVTDQIKGLNEAMNEAASSKDWASFNSMAAAMNNLENYRRGVVYESKGIQSNLPMQNPVNNLMQNTTGLVNTAGNGISALGSGNFGGMITSASQGISSLGKLIPGLSGGTLATILGPLAIAAGVGVGVNKASNIWEEKMDDALINNTLYNEDRFSLSSKENSQRLRDRYSNAGNLRRGTQYSTEETIQLQNDMAKYGYTANNVDAETRALLVAQQNTGASRDALAKLAGMQNLYGYNGAMAVQNAYQGLKNSGMTDARFDEFLDGITRAMEDGVSKGFVGSVEDIVNNVTLFSRLSGGAEIWTGKNGAERLSKMSNGFAGAVGLNSTNDLMMYGAAQGVVATLKPEAIEALAKQLNINAKMLQNDPALTARLIMEQGSNGAYFTDILKGYSQNVQTQFAGMPEYQLQAYKSAFGLNITGASQLQSLLDNWASNGYATDITSEVASIIDDVKNKSTETEYKSEINDIKDIATKIGQEALDTKEAIVNSIARDVSLIYNFLTKDVPVITPEVSKKIINSVSSPEAAEKIEKEINEAVKDGELKLDNSFDASVNDRALASAIEVFADPNDYLSKIKSHYTDTNGISFANAQLISLNSNKFARNILTEEGNEEFDDIFFTLAQEASEKGGFKKPFFKITGKRYDANGMDDSEMSSILNKANSTDEVKSAYENGDRTAYINALKDMLKELFGNINFTSYSSGE